MTAGSKPPLPKLNMCPADMCQWLVAADLQHWRCLSSAQYAARATSSVKMGKQIPISAREARKPTDRRDRRRHVAEPDPHRRNRSLLFR